MFRGPFLEPVKGIHHFKNGGFVAGAVKDSIISRIAEIPYEDLVFGTNESVLFQKWLTFQLRITLL